MKYLVVGYEDIFDNLKYYSSFLLFEEPLLFPKKYVGIYGDIIALHNVDANLKFINDIITPKSINEELIEEVYLSVGFYQGLIKYSKFITKNSIMSKRCSFSLYSSISNALDSYKSGLYYEEHDIDLNISVKDILQGVRIDEFPVKLEGLFPPF